MQVSGPGPNVIPLHSCGGTQTPEGSPTTLPQTTVPIRGVIFRVLRRRPLPSGPGQPDLAATLRAQRASSEVGSRPAKAHRTVVGGGPIAVPIEASGRPKRPGPGLLTLPVLHSLARTLARLTSQAPPTVEQEPAQRQDLHALQRPGDIIELRAPRTDPGDLPRILLPPTGTEGAWDADGSDLPPQALNVSLDDGIVDSLLQLVPLELAELDEGAILTNDDDRRPGGTVDLSELSTPSYILAPIRSLLERRRSLDGDAGRHRVWRLTPLARVVLLLAAAPLGVIAARWLLELFA